LEGWGGMGEDTPDHAIKKSLPFCHFGTEIG